MRSRSVVCVLAIVFFLSSGLLRAQQSVSAPPLGPPPAGIVDGAVAPIQAPAGVEESASPWTIDFLLGLPLGVRVQRAVGPSPDSPFLLEGFAGFFIIFPGVGVGARLQWVPLCGKHNSLMISPGVDAYLLDLGITSWFHSNSSAAGLLVGDVDIAWHHSYARGSDGQIGVKLGVGTVIEGGNGFIPIVAVFAGWRF